MDKELKISRQVGAPDFPLNLRRRQRRENCFGAEAAEQSIACVRFVRFLEENGYTEQSGGSVAFGWERGRRCCEARRGNLESPTVKANPKIPLRRVPVLGLPLPFVREGVS